MDQLNPIQSSVDIQNTEPNVATLSVNAGNVDSAVLKRLIEEVQFEQANNVNAYNRTHNRHNRGR